MIGILARFHNYVHVYCKFRTKNEVDGSGKHDSTWTLGKHHDVYHILTNLIMMQHYDFELFEMF